ncbi:MAG: hypothetical protein FWE57_03220 [Chitinispirillia bacterium]|nr:hypothetical protein [Chitinispirillia bacterium]
MPKRTYNTFCVTVLMTIAVIILSPQFSYSRKFEIAPQWIQESWREVSYPQKEWYTGFSQDAVPRNANVAQIIQRVENEARNRMAQGISVHISGTSQTRTTSSQTRQGEKVDETIGRDYEQLILASTNAQVVKAQTHSFHDQQNNRVFAFAAVKRSDLAAYYASLIENGLSEARREFDLSKQLAAAGDNRGAAEKTAQSRNKVQSLVPYREMLITIDPENGLKRSQRERADELLKQLTAAQIELQNDLFVYLTSKETILGEETDIIISGLQTLLTQSNGRIAADREAAGFVLTIEARVANPKSDGVFHYCNAAVRVNLINTKTNKSEALINVNGPKEGSMTAQSAAEAAFKSAVPVIWAQIKDKIAVN